MNPNNKIKNIRIGIPAGPTASTASDAGPQDWPKGCQHDIGKAHQRRIRETLAEVEPAFAADIETAVVKEFGVSEARTIIQKYEWLGTMPAFIVRCFGIFFNGICGGAVIYSTEYAENLGVWDKFDFTGKIICLSRGACVHWAHPHSASKLIRTSMRMLPAKYKVVTCTVDSQAGEIGTIYQACGFDYVGQMSKGGNRASIIGPDGKHISARTAYTLYGTRSIKKLRKMGLTVSAVPRKSRYFGFTGTKKEGSSGESVGNLRPQRWN